MARELQGVAELTAKLNALGVEVAAKNLRGVARAAMKPAYEKAKATIPVGSVPHKTYKGRLVAPGFASRNVRLVSSVSKVTGIARAAIGVAKEAFYAVNFLEFGTSKMPAQPWLRNALESTQSEVLSRIGSEMKKRLERIAKKRA